MDNISPLRRMSAEAAGDALHLYKPNGVPRLDRALAVDYWLRRRRKVTIDVMDAQGESFTFAGTAADAAASRRNAAERRRFPPAARSSRPPDGLHRLTWDMLYPGATDFPGLIMWAASSRGPEAPPGAYQVKVTAGDQTETQPFAIRREPRLLKDVSDQDLREEFDLAMKVRDKASQANEAVLLVRGIRPQIADRKGKLDAKAGPTAKALDDLEHALTAVEVEVYQVKNQSGQDPLNYPIKLNNKIAALQGIVESADTEPTEQLRGVQLLSGQLAAQLKNWTPR